MKKITSMISMLVLITACSGKSEKSIMIGLVNFVSGTAVIISSDGKETPAVTGLPVDRGMKIRTRGVNSLCEIYINENAVKIFGNAEVSVDTLLRDKKTDVEKTYISLNTGRGFFKIKNRLMKNQDFTVRTKNCTAAVRGTEFFVANADGLTSVACLDGSVNVKSNKDNSSVEIEANQQAVASGKSKPVKSDIGSEYVESLEKDAEVKPLTEENIGTFDKIGAGDKKALSGVRKKLKELRTPREIKEKEKEESEGGVNLFFFKTK